jgi:hypothetical protein
MKHIPSLTPPNRRLQRTLASLAPLKRNSLGASQYLQRGTHKEKIMAEQNNSSFIRWQDKSIEQLSYINNLLITLASGFLILETKYFIGEKSAQATEILLLGLSAFFVFASLILGGILAINRLLSFSHTAQIARKRETKQREGIEELRDWTNEVDSRTWLLLWWQVGLFTFGSLFLFIIIMLGFAQQLLQMAN